MQQKNGVTILGVYVTDLAFLASRQPAVGETIAGSGFVMGPGGKGSNQAVAASLCGAPTRFITRIGDDEFARLARDTWQRAGVTSCAIVDKELPTGAANIYVNDESGENAIIVFAGASAALNASDADASIDSIKNARVFMTQLEQPIEAAQRGLEIARQNQVTTILNPAPAMALSDDMFALCDYVTPNEIEAAALTGLSVKNVNDAETAARALLDKGTACAIITLGELGVLLCDGERTEHVPAISYGEVVDTTGAGDAFNGGFAAALARGDDAIAAARFGCAVAGISVTRRGAANAMPTLEEVNNVLKEPLQNS